MTIIYLVRHGESTWNVERRWAGHADPPLSEAGREQTLAACALLATLEFDGVVSSSLLRARETAELVAGRLKLPLHDPLPEFDERYAGEISGLTSGEIEVKFPGLLEDWRQGNPIEIPGGESWAHFIRRVVQGFRQFKDHSEKRIEKRILLVAHEGVLRAVAAHLKEPHKKHGNLQGRWLKCEGASLLPGTI